MTDDFIPEPKDEPAGRWDHRDLTEAESERLREMEILAQAEAEETGQGGAPAGLVVFLIVPFLLLALALFLFWGLRSVSNPVPASAPVATMTPPTGS